MAAKKTSAKTKAPKLPKSGPKGGRPRIKLDVSAALNFGTETQKLLDMSQRQALESLFQEILQGEINDLQQMKADVRVVLQALRAQIESQSKGGHVDLRLLALQESYQKRSRAISKDLVS